MNEDLLVEEATVLLDRVLAHQRNEGDFLGNDVYTYHLVEALQYLDPESLKVYIEAALSWFENLDDPRDRNPRALSPFRLLTLANAGRAGEYVEESIKKIETYMVGADGNINLPIGFIEAPDTYDTFPTMMAVQILLNSPKNGENVRRALLWSCSRLDDTNRPGTLGFLLFTIMEAEFRGITVPLEEKLKVISAFSEVCATESLVEDSFQAAYIAFDLATFEERSQVFPCPHSAQSLIHALLQRKRVSEEDFYDGQDRALTDLRMLAAIGRTMSPEQRSAFRQKQLSDAFAGKVTAKREHLLLRQQNEELRLRIRMFESVDRGEGLFISTRWDVPVQPVDPKLVFWLMPIPDKKSTVAERNLETTFRELIWPSLEKELGLRILRADQIFNVLDVMQTTWDSIVRARIVVADISGNNPNVLYELGIADAINKEVVLLTSTIEKVPFNLRSRRIVTYGLAYPGPFELQKALLLHFESILEGRG